MRPLFFILIVFTALTLKAQNPELNKYNFGNGLTFSGKDNFKLNLRGYLQPYVDIKNYTQNLESNNLTRFRLRRLRLRLTGKAPERKLDYRFQIDLSGSSEVGDGPSSFLLDAWVRYSLTKRIKLTFGQKATPTDNRELTMGSQTLQLVERSRLTSAFSSIRDFGLYLEGSFKTDIGSFLRPAFAITNGDGLNVYGSDHGGLKVGGRIDFLPFGLFTNFGQFRQGDLVRENAPKLVIGANYSHNQGISSRRGRASGAILYLNSQREESLPNYTKYGVDFLFKLKGFSMLGEFVGSAATVPEDISQRVRNDGSVSSTFNVNGVQDIANYVKGRMMLGRAYNIQMGYIFKSLWSIDMRYTHLDADEYSFLNNGAFYNRPNYYTLGASKYLSKSYGIKIQGSITYAELNDGSNDIFGGEVSGGEWIARMITSIAF